jgi:hypothetical protein
LYACAIAPIRRADRRDALDPRQRRQIRADDGGIRRQREFPDALAIFGEVAEVRGVGFARCVRLARFCEVAGAVDGLGKFGREGCLGGVSKHLLPSNPCAIMGRYRTQLT